MPDTTDGGLAAGGGDCTPPRRRSPLSGRIRPLTKLFGFVAVRLRRHAAAGRRPLPGARRWARGGGERAGPADAGGAPPAAGRRRRRPRRVGAEAEPAALPLTRATAIRAFAPFADEGEAARWLDEACEAEDTVDVLVDEGLALLNRALHAQAVAAADPTGQASSRPRRPTRSGSATAAARRSPPAASRAAREVDVRASGASRRRRREEELRPQERVAAVLGGREQLDACETLLLRARADLDAGRDREAALQLRVGLEALLVELKGALSDPGHEEDMGTLTERKAEAGSAANAALQGGLSAEQRAGVEDLLRICERVLRRRRVLRG